MRENGDMAAPLPGIRASRVVATFAVGVFGIGGFGLIAACSEEPERTVAAYCDEVGANIDALTAPNVATGVDIEPLIDRYRSIAAVAPATVEPEWQELVSALETASTVVAGDTESLEIATRAALAGQPAYTRIQHYTQTECQIAIGTPPPPTNPVTATTAVPPSTAATTGG
jgi:hypothetical protein